MFIGDDVTDEDGFDTVNGLGGMTVRVGGNDGSKAQYTLDDVSSVRHWLRATLLRESVT